MTREMLRAFNEAQLLDLFTQAEAEIISRADENGNNGQDIDWWRMFKEDTAVHHIAGGRIRVIVSNRYAVKVSVAGGVIAFEWNGLENFLRLHKALCGRPC